MWRRRQPRPSGQWLIRLPLFPRPLFLRPLIRHPLIRWPWNRWPLFRRRLNRRGRQQIRRSWDRFPPLARDRRDAPAEQTGSGAGMDSAAQTVPPLAAAALCDETWNRNGHNMLLHPDFRVRNWNSTYALLRLPCLNCENCHYYSTIVALRRTLSKNRQQHLMAAASHGKDL